MGAIDKAANGARDILKTLLIIAIVLAIVVGVGAATGFLTNALHDIGAFFHGIWVGGDAALKDMKKNWR
jgi:predicted Kef-type K+ transport protein